MSLAQKNPNTYYVAPEFNGESEFNNSFLARQIVNNCRIIQVDKCDPINDGDQHYITFQAGNFAWTQHSESKRHDNSRSGKEIELIYRESHEQWKPIDRSFIQNLFESTSQTVEQRIREESGIDRSALSLLTVPPEQQNREGFLRRTADLLSVFYGLTLVIVGTRQ